MNVMQVKSTFENYPKITQPLWWDRYIQMSSQATRLLTVIDLGNSQTYILHYFVFNSN